MPKKKITEEVPQETIERLDEAATEEKAPLYADAAETAAEETERAVLGETESAPFAENVLKMDDDAEESSLFLSAEGTPDIVAVRLEDGTAPDMANVADMSAMAHLKMLRLMMRLRFRATLMVLKSRQPYPMKRKKVLLWKTSAIGSLLKTRFSRRFRQRAKNPSLTRQSRRRRMSAELSMVWTSMNWIEI